MKKSKKVLRYSIFFFFFLSLIYLFLYHIRDHSSVLNEKDTIFQGKILEMYKVNGGYSFVFDVGERLSGTYFQEELTFSLGDIVTIKGTLSLPKNNTAPNLFSYREYLKWKKQYYVIEIESMELIQKNMSIFYTIKNTILEYLSKYQSSTYLKLFLLGDKHELDEDVSASYQKNGISHLFAISGMHISLLNSILMFFLSKFISQNKSKIFIFVFLFFYMFLVGLSPSIVRAVIFSFLLYLNKLFRLELTAIDCFVGMLTILLFIDPFYIHQVSFQYSVFISFILICFQKRISNYSYWKGLFFVSCLSFFSSLPISIFYFYEVNFLSMIWNLIFVPFVSFIVFPFSLVVCLFPFLDSCFLKIIECLENLSFFFQYFDFLLFGFRKPSFLWIFIYYIFFFLFFSFRKKKYIFLLFFLLIGLYFYNFLFPSTYFIVIDVGQGDSILFHSHNQTVLLDTGGKFSQTENHSIANDILLPLLKSFGIHSIDYLVISHGDYDHMGEAVYLVNNFKVNKVIFNRGEYNALELELIKVLNDKNIPYYQNVKEVNIDNHILYFLNYELYDNENDNSNVIYMKINGIQILLMGDAGIDVEEDILEKYNLKEIDILKIGHHGSKTSSDEKFIAVIDPKYSIISVGKNNRYGHPNKEVLDILDDSIIYRTDLDGSVMFKVYNNKFCIKTWLP